MLKDVESERSGERMGKVLVHVQLPTLLAQDTILLLFVL